MKGPNYVGLFIREKRESVGLSQKALGNLFDPPVTTQFISNIERGVTPLPTPHIPVLLQALKITESDLMARMEREYAAKLSGKLGVLESWEPQAQTMVAPSVSNSGVRGPQSLAVLSEHFDYLRAVYNAYRNASVGDRAHFHDAVLRVLKINPPLHETSPPAKIAA